MKSRGKSAEGGHWGRFEHRVLKSNRDGSSRSIGWTGVVGTFADLELLFFGVSLRGRRFSCLRLFVRVCVGFYILDDQ